LLHIDSPRNRRIGIALVSLTTLLFATLDACAKWLVLSLPVLQVVWLRFLTHVIITSAVLAPTYGRELVRVRNWKLQGLRAAMLGTMTALNFGALQYLQLAETAAMQFSVPLLIALLSAWWLGERLDARRWVAIAVGFGGVLLIVRPGSHAFHPAMLFMVGQVFLYATFNILTRRLAATESAASLQLMSALGATVLLAPFGLAPDLRLWLVRWPRALLRRHGPPLRVGGHARPVPVPADHLHDAVGMVRVRPGTRRPGGGRRHRGGRQRAVPALAGDEAALRRRTISSTAPDGS
jgi:drug/metabolite transporter (DMT)-like permease